jgi:RNA polymerase primary sigma factor
MDSSAQLHQRSMHEWEDWLMPQVRRVTLLGEIKISAPECKALGHHIHVNVHTVGQSRALQVLTRDYPCSLAVYLVAQGIYGYEGGNYWSEVLKDTGFSKNYTWQLGRAFEDFLEEFELPLFYDMRQDAHRYISVILAHGGIPNYCLPDFFGNILQPSILKESYADMTANEIIQALQSESSALYLTDIPVMRFLTHGGVVAENFLERCREMALEAYETGVLPQPEEIGLTERVVNAYRSWLAKQSVKQKRSASPDRWRLYKPKMVIDPWGEGLMINLPAEQIPATKTKSKMAWKMVTGETVQTVPVRVRRRGFDLKTEATAIVLRRPAQQYEISFIVDGETRRTWKFDGINDERQILVFDADDYGVLSWQHSLPTGYLGFLYPLDVEMEIEGPSAKIREFQRFAGEWSDYHGAVFDLNQAHKCVLRKANGEVLTIPIRQDLSALRPKLVGEKALKLRRGDSKTLLYQGTLPRIYVPTPKRTTTHGQQTEELKSWRITIRNHWPAIPDVDVRTRLSDLQDHVVSSESGFELPLNIPELLGKAPFGNYRVQLRGPIGRDATFEIHVVPHLVIQGHEKLHLPTSQGEPQPVTLEIEVPQKVNLETPDGASIRSATNKDIHAAYEILVEPEVTDVDLILAHDTISGEVARVSVSIPLRRLQWALSSEDATTLHRTWTGRTLQRTVDDFLNLSAPALLVSVPVSEDQNEVHMQLFLQDFKGNRHQDLESNSVRGSEHLRRFDLAAFEDTIREVHSPGFRFGLQVWEAPDASEYVEIPVLSLKRKIFITDIDLHVLQTEEDIRFVLEWHEDQTLENRCVRLWPLWRPWEPPIELTIPDNSEGSWRFKPPLHEMQSGKYRVEFFVSDPWIINNVSHRPELGSPGTKDVELIIPDKQLEYLDHRIEKQGLSFDLVLERVFVRHDAGLSFGVHEDCQWCYDHLDDSSMKQLLAFADFVSESNVRDIFLPLQLRMSVPRRVRQVIRLWQSGDLSDRDFQRYIDHLPQFEKLSMETLELFLDIKDESLRIAAVQELLERRSKTGVKALLTWMQKAAISDADAVALATEQANFVVECLQGYSENPIANRLLRGLKRTSLMEDAVHVGDWIHCDAGWGRIEVVENQHTGAELMWVAELESPYQIQVILRPDVKAEEVVIDLERRTLGFSNAARAYVCEQCKSFITQSLSILKEHFARVHPPRKGKKHGRTDYKTKWRQPEELIELQHLTRFVDEPEDQLLPPDQS